jgi:hypothetical protein
MYTAGMYGDLLIHHHQVQLAGRMIMFKVPCIERGTVPYDLSSLACGHYALVFIEPFRDYTVYPSLMQLKFSEVAKVLLRTMLT